MGVELGLTSQGNNWLCENRVLRRMFGCKREEVARGCTKLCYLFSSLNTIRETKSRMRWAGHVARMGEMNTYRTSVGKCKGKRHLGTSVHGWEDDTKVGLEKTGCDGVNWFHMDQNRVQWLVMMPHVAAGGELASY
jgi:hypothetical protein